MDVKQFKELPILGILRGIKADAVIPLTETIIKSGLKTIELALNTPDAVNLIKKTVKQANGRLIVGAGTVLSLDDLKRATDAGATFIVSPVLIPDVVEHCVKHKIPVFPGAFTPQEIYNAWSAGATMVKVFPAKFFGPDYIKEVKAPLNNIELLACGGVNKNNIAEFFVKGASAVAFGASVFCNEWIEKGEFDKIITSIRGLIEKNNGR